MYQIFCARRWALLLCTVLFWSCLLRTPAAGASIEASRLPASPWAGNVGVPGGIPTNYTMYCNVRVSIPGTNLLAVADGVTDDAPAINYAVQHCPNGQYVYLPAGTYATYETITRKGVNEYDNVQRPFSIEIKGDGPALTRILFYGTGGDAIYFNPANGENAQTMGIVSGDTRGSTELTLSGMSKYMAAGIYAIVHRINAEATAGNDAPYMIDTASQMVKVTAVNAATGTITFTPALNESYPSDYVTIGISAPYRTGVQDLYVQNMTNNDGHNIEFDLGQECWIKNVESNNTAHWHVRLQTCARCEVRECKIHDGWSAGGDHDYGVGLFQYSCNNLVENNVFYNCRHAMEMEYGGQGNVFGYNYDFNPVNSDLGAGLAAELATDYLMGDQLNHGGDMRWNLREGNVAATIKFDCVLGASSYNTAFRNQIQRRGLPPVVVANFGSDLQKWNHYTNLSGNVYEAPPTGYAGGLRRWGTNQDAATTVWTVTGASNTNPVVLTVSGTAFGTGDVVTVTGVGGNTAANVASATITYVDATHFSLDGVDGTASGAYTGGGTATSGIDARVEATTILDGEFDAQSGTLTWAGSDQTLPASYYLTAKPAWFGSLAWPAVDPTNPSGNGTALIPAGYRQASGTPPPMAPYVGAAPVAADVSAGTPATFVAEFEAFPAPTVQWQVSTNNGATWSNVTAPGPYTVTTVAPPNSVSATATRTTLTVATGSSGLSGNLYQCVATNTHGTIDSGSAGLTVTGSTTSSAPATVAPAFTLEPQAQTVTYLASPSVTLTVAATGTPTPTYQWMLNGAALHDGGRISGSATASLTITGPQVADSGNYSAVASNGVNPSATSSAAALTVNPATQTLTFTLPASVAFGGAAPALAATASSGLAVTYASSNTKVATVSGTTLTLVGTGTTTITASQPGTSNYAAAAPVSVSLLVASSQPTVTVSTGPTSSSGSSGSSAPTASAPSLTNGPAASGTVGTAFSYRVTASGSPTSFAATGLPAGLSINATTGQIGGTPTTAGTFTANLSATNSAGTGTSTMTFTVAAAAAAAAPAAAVPAITSARTASATVGSAFSYLVTATGSPTSFSATGLPAGLVLNPSTGVISGTPAAAGSFAVSVGATNTAGSVGVTVTFTVAAAAASAPAAPSTSYAGVYFGTFGSGGSWALDVGTGNTGLFISKAGSVTVSQNVVVASNGTFTVSAPTGTAVVVHTAATDALPYQGKISSGAVTGTAGSDTFSGALDGASPASPYAGAYVTSALLGATGNVMVVVGPDRRVFAVEMGTTSSDTAGGTLSASGTLNSATAGGGNLTLTTSAEGQMLVTFTAAGTSNTVEYLGLATTTVSTARIINLSARASVGAGTNIMIAGAVVSGQTVPVLLRAVGPSLASYGVADVLSAPQLQLYQGAELMAQNTGWGGGAALAADFSSVGAFALPSESADDALATNLAPNAYTIQVSGADSATGTALAEIYSLDTSAGAGRLVDISTRAQVGPSSTLIAGFVIAGNGPETILIRAIGPGLSQFGLTDVLPAPVLNLMDGKGNQLATNQGWGGGADLAAAASSAGAFAVPADSKDSELLVTLAPGSYTAVVASADTGSGTALAEVYEIQ